MREAQLYSIWQFQWCQQSHRCQFQATNMVSLTGELGEVHNPLSRAGMSRLQHTTVAVSREPIQPPGPPSFPKGAMKFKRKDTLFIPLYFWSSFIYSLEKTVFGFQVQKKAPHCLFPPPLSLPQIFSSCCREFMLQGDIHTFFL